MVLNEPCDTIVGTAALFVGGKSDHEVANRHEALFLELHEISEPDGGLRFVITGAAAVEVAVFFVELEGSML